MRQPEVLVVDDEHAIRLAVERMLRFEGFAVRLAENGRQALDEVDLRCPAAIVLDIAMPGISGVSVIRRLRERGIEVPLCVLSARDEVADRVAGLQAGADDYLVKPFAPEELLARLRAMLRRGREHGGQAITLGDLSLDPRLHSARRGNRELELSRREFELLYTFARHPAIVLRREQLLDLVWGYPADVQTNVVDVFVGYLRRKLEADGEPRILQTVRGVGFTLRVAGSER
jgi:DNA-binding response OmpR family regulator